MNDTWTIRDEYRLIADGGDRFTVLNAQGEPAACFPTRVKAEQYIASLLTSAPDPVNRPAHYTFGGIEVIDAIEAWGLDFHLGNAVKYIVRAKHKGNEKQDLEKARWYLERAIKNLEKSQGREVLDMTDPTEPRGCPTPGACSALHLCAEVATWKRRYHEVSDKGLGWQDRAERAEQARDLLRNLLELLQINLRDPRITDVLTLIDKMNGIAR